MQMTIRGFVRNFQELVEQQITRNSVQIGKGQCANFEEYKRKVGFNDGLHAANALADEMLKKMEESSDDKDLPTMGGKR